MQIRGAPKSDRTPLNAPSSLQTFMQASGGGAVAAAGLDENNDYNVVSNGGAYVDPTYVSPGS